MMSSGKRAIVWFCLLGAGTNAIAWTAIIAILSGVFGSTLQQTTLFIVAACIGAATLALLLFLSQLEQGAPHGTEAAVAVDRPVAVPAQTRPALAPQAA